MGNKLIEKVDQTIEKVCECLNDRIERNVNAREISEMTNALASLISARANAITFYSRTN